MGFFSKIKDGLRKPRNNGKKMQKVVKFLYQNRRGAF